MHLFRFALPSKGTTVRQKRAARPTALTFEALEPRIAMAAAGLVPIGAQPDGNLSGKIVYINGGHGITANTGALGVGGSGAWSFQRPLLLGMIEDLGNQDQMSTYADYAFRAGATVVPMRPVGYQPNEVILDNDDVGVTFTGAWSNNSATPYFGSPGDVGARTAPTSPTETATARFTPSITIPGFYPVYAWTSSGSNRAADQLYRVNHSGGSTEITVNHRMVGNGLIYLGTYHFEAGTGGSVEISNRSSEAGRVVVADMIRFGNGLGDTARAAGVSGRSREDEAALYWVEWHAQNAVGVPTSAYRNNSNGDRDATVSATPRYSAYMNRSTEGSPSDRVLITFHSNAAGGRGVVGLHNTASGGDTPNQLLLAQMLGQEVNNDLVAQNGQFEHNWSNRGSNVTYQADFNYGELNNVYINDEFDATILEVAFHDNQLDAELMRDPKVRDAVSKATYQGTAKFLNAIDGGQTSLTMLPGRVPTVRAEVVGPDSVKLTWTAPAANSYNGDAPTGYWIYGSTNGYGFDGGTLVSGGATTYTITGLDAAEGAYFFKVAAVNSGGEGAASEVVAAMPGEHDHRILIVNGFDRITRQQNPLQAVPGGQAERVRPRQSNSFDYAAVAGAAIEANSPNAVVDTTSNEMVANGSVDLADYEAVIWLTGEESTADATFNPAEQAAVTTYLAAGGKLLASGAEIAWDLDQSNNGRSFYENVLRSNFVSDDANSYVVNAAAGSIFAGMTFSIDNGSQFYDANFPDVIAPNAGSNAALTYGTGGTAAVQYADDGTGARILVFGFPFESILTAPVRSAILGQALAYFGFDLTPDDVDAVLDNDNGSPTYVENGTWTTSLAPGYNGLTYRFGTVGAPNASATWTFNAAYAGRAEIFVQYRSGSNRATNAVYDVDTGDGIHSISVNQVQNDETWVSLGVFDLAAGPRTITLNAAASTGGSVVIADVVRVVLSASFEPTGDFDNNAVVDGADFLAWQRGLGLSGAANLAHGDGDADRDVDADDLVIWTAAFGADEPPQESLAALLGPATDAVAPAAIPSAAFTPPLADDLRAGERTGSPAPQRAPAVREFQFAPVPRREFEVSAATALPQVPARSPQTPKNARFGQASAEIDALDDVFGRLTGFKPG